MDELNKLDAMTPLVDPRITHIVGSELVDSIEALNFDTVGDLWSGIQLYPESFRNLLGASFDDVEEQLTALMSKDAIAHFRNNREVMNASIHNPLTEKRFAELYSIPGVLQVRSILPHQEELQERATVIACIDVREVLNVIPLIEKFNKEHNENVGVIPIVPIQSK